MTTQVVLTAKLDSSAAKTLRDQILLAKDDDVLLDGTNVEYLGGLCLELLMSARHLWHKSGKSFAVENPSKNMVEDLGRFGLPDDAFSGDAA